MEVQSIWMAPDGYVLVHEALSVAMRELWPQIMEIPTGGSAPSHDEVSRLYKEKQGHLKLSLSNAARRYVIRVYVQDGTAMTRLSTTLAAARLAPWDQSSNGIFHVNSGPECKLNGRPMLLPQEDFERWRELEGNARQRETQGHLSAEFWTCRMALAWIMTRSLSGVGVVSGYTSGIDVLIALVDHALESDSPFACDWPTATASAIEAAANGRVVVSGICEGSRREIPLDRWCAPRARFVEDPANSLVFVSSGERWHELLFKRADVQAEWRASPATFVGASSGNDALADAATGGGRRSHKKAIAGEHARRVGSNTAIPGVKREAVELQEWFVANHPGDKAPAVGTIENQIRERHRSYAMRFGARARPKAGNSGPATMAKKHG